MYVFVLAHAPVAFMSSFVSPLSVLLDSSTASAEKIMKQSSERWVIEDILNFSVCKCSCFCHYYPLLAAISETFFEVAQIMLDLDT